MAKIRFCLKTALFFTVFYWVVAGISTAADLETDDQIGAVGSSVTFTVSVNSAPNGVSTFGFDVSFDAAILTYDRFEKGALAETGFTFFDVNAPASGVLRVGGLATGGDAITQGESGELVQLVFHVVGEGSCDVVISNLADSVDTWTTGNGRFVSDAPLVNTPPISRDQHVVTKANTRVGIMLDASDADGDVLTYWVVADPAFGTLGGTPPNLTYTPAPDYAGSDSFMFRANDGQADSDAATVSITVEPAAPPVNTPPQASDLNIETVENTPVSVTLSASDPDGDMLSYEVRDEPSYGTLTGVAPDLVYTPDPGFSGSDLFTFRANDGHESGVGSVRISVTPNGTLPENTPPVAYDQNVTTTEGTPVSVTLSATDADGDTLTYEIVNSSTNGTLSGTPPAVTYAPATGYAGSDSFTFRANDGQSDSNTASVFVHVEAKTVEPDPVEPTPTPTPNTSDDSGGGGGGGGCFVSVSAGD